MRIQRGTLLSAIVFVVVTGALIALVGATFSRTKLQSNRDYRAIFSDASGLVSGVDVRASGVDVGTVRSIKLHPGGVIVDFDVATTVPVTSTTTARIRYANLTGDRYLDLSPGTASGTTLAPGSTIPLAQTRPALDIDTLFAGFSPLMQALDPDEVNKLTANIIAVSQGQAGAVQSMLTNVGSFTNGLAAHDTLIGDVITQLSTALSSVDSKRGQFDHLIAGLTKLLQGLADDRKQIGGSLDGINTLAGDVTDLLHQVRPSFKADIVQTGAIAAAMNKQETLVQKVLDLYPSTIQRLGRGGAYGSFFNFFLCSVQAHVTLPGLPQVQTPRLTSGADRCKFPEDR